MAQRSLAEKGLHMTKKRILCVEDDPDIAELVSLHLRDLHFHVDRADDGEAGLEQALANEYNLVILDLMLPKLDGLEVCKRIRRDREQLPILMLTAKTEEFDKVLGLELGADDYLTKPFSVRELMARVKAILRRTTSGTCANRPIGRWSACRKSSATTNSSSSPIGSSDRGPCSSGVRLMPGSIPCFGPVHR